MRHFATAVAAVLLSAPAIAGTLEYKPFGGLSGQGYKHKVEGDGSWRIVAEYSTRDPIISLDVALYRAAELAREAGQPYVQILGGDASGRMGVATAIIYARGSGTAQAPSVCRRSKTCYTADVAKVLAALGGPSGNEPGVAKPTSVDRFGRTVTVSGFGTGAVAWSR